MRKLSNIITIYHLFIEIQNFFDNFRAMGS